MIIAPRPHCPTHSCARARARDVQAPHRKPHLSPPCSSTAAPSGAAPPPAPTHPPTRPPAPTTSDPPSQLPAPAPTHPAAHPTPLACPHQVLEREARQRLPSLGRFRAQFDKCSRKFRRQCVGPALASNEGARGAARGEGGERVWGVPGTGCALALPRSAVEC